MKRILIVNVNWLGDTLFATPFIRAVREKYPGAYIAILTHPRCYKMLEGNPNIDEIIIYDEKKQHRNLLGKFSIASYIRSKKFDAAFILKKSLSRTLLLLFSKIPRRIGYGSKRAGFLLTEKAGIPDKKLHKVEYFLNLAKAAGIETKNKNYEILISDNDTKEGEKILNDAGIKDKGFIALNAGGNWDLKRWPAENFAELGDKIFEKLGSAIILTGAEKDIVLAENIAGLMKHRPLILCGKTTLKTLGAIFKKAICVISNDSGPMHLAVAVGTRVVAIFGPTSPELTGPYGDGRYIVLRKDTGCKIPCYDLKCKDNRCMKAVTAEDVLGALYEIIKHP
ncbi:MAG: lipopolysaccharide heptosyltransferase II [Candidatus Omnitrophica bacterium CG02_land_8_20_14_3_00__42_8]|nr:MAG: lipopolysaccharide heptosyltransferase II [Candidatus Omnitrophica bacterium CG02_land_8_20_14_3_00__42_8]PIW67967.1 MAG: lipopolysaccharide heptosyltransferase II [Candidatus Omnitrophica bacterium CG12_big_fil_rev_8_21_14_0_65_42_8]